MLCSSLVLSFDISDCAAEVLRACCFCTLSIKVGFFSLLTDVSSKNNIHTYVSFVEKHFEFFGGLFSMAQGLYEGDTFLKHDITY